MPNNIANRRVTKPLSLPISSNKLIRGKAIPGVIKTSALQTSGSVAPTSVEPTVNQTQTVSSSVALTAPTAVFSVSGSPVNGQGTIALSFKNQNANLVWAGPVSGGPAVPTFRALVAADLPTGTTPVGANPTAFVGLTAVNGIATTFMRSDAAPPLSQSIVPIWTGLHTFSNGVAVTGGTMSAITGLGLRDLSAAFDLTIAANSSIPLSAGRTLTFDVSNAARTVKLIGNPTLADWFDQTVKTTAAPNWSGITITTDRNLLFTNQTNAAAAQTATLTNAPVAGNPGFWLKIQIGGVNYTIPCWAA